MVPVGLPMEAILSAGEMKMPSLKAKCHHQQKRQYYLHWQADRPVGSAGCRSAFIDFHHTLK